MSLQDWLHSMAAATIRDGYGIPSAPLSDGEYVSAGKACPHEGCDWELPVEWRKGATITRLRGTIETDRLCQQHLETHVVENWSQS